MAEIAVNVVVDKLVPLLAQEEEESKLLLKGVRKDVESIKDELESIRSFVREADVKAETDESVKAWVKQVGEVAYRTEDVMDEYLLHRRSKQASACQSCGLGVLINEVAACCLTKKLISDEIQDIKTTLCEIKATRPDMYKFLDSDSNASSSEQGSSSSSTSNSGGGVPAVSWHHPGLASLFIGETDIVGFEEPTHQLNQGLLLLDGESKRTTISLYGMGGLGKTTLAQIVFNNQKLKGMFDCHAWITVSQSSSSSNMVELLRTMMKQFNDQQEEVFAAKDIDAMDQTRLVQALREFLLIKRYLVVFDDVWDIDFWGSMEHALPKNEKSSRIVITTRKSDVASSSSTHHVIALQPLSQEEAWKLFCKKTFKSEYLDGRCPPELEELSLDIVKKCQGLPLAIVLVGGVLSRRDKVSSQWRMFHESLPSDLENNNDPQLLPSITTKILSLCYYDLPYYLKSCFLYFGIFPEDYYVRRGRLIRLWVAEGFVKEAADKTMEEVAEDYLSELIHRSLVKVSEVFFDGRARSCQIHDLVADFILQKHNELNFCHPSFSFGGSIRRLSICNSKVNVPKITNLPKLRSLCMFGENELPNRFPNTVTKTFKLLKILDFEDAPITSVPDEVGNLFHLRYLSVRDTKVSMLTKSIGKLQNLQTLELRGATMNLLPGDIVGLPKLRHLLVGSTRRGVKIPEGIGSLEALQNLCYVEGDRGLVRDLRKLKQLRKLGILDLKEENGEALCTAIEDMRHLRSLFVCSINEFEEVLDLQSISSPPPLLQRLYLKGRLEKLPDWISKLHNLTKIRFVMAKLSDDPLNVLQALRNLLELWLEDAYVGEQLHFEATGGFLKLKILRVHEFDRVTRLKWVMIDEGALPLLQELKIHYHIQLKEGCPGMLQHRNVRIW